MSDVRICFCDDYSWDKAECADLLKKLQEGLVFAGLNLKVKKCGNHQRVHINKSEIACIEKHVKETLVAYLQDNKLDTLFSELDDPNVVKKCKKILITFINTLCQDENVPDSDVKKFFVAIPDGNLNKFVSRICYREIKHKPIDHVIFNRKFVHFVYDLIAQEDGKCTSLNFSNNKSCNTVKNVFELVSLYLDCTSVEKIDVSHCDLEMFPSMNLDDFSLLKLLDVSNNSISHITHDHIKKIKKNKKLVVDFSWNSLNNVNNRRLENALGSQVVVVSQPDIPRQNLVLFCLFCPLFSVVGTGIVTCCIIPFIIGCVVVYSCYS
jgi:hypothetical protein